MTFFVIATQSPVGGGSTKVIRSLIGTLVKSPRVVIPVVDTLKGIHDGNDKKG